jgi:nitrogen fixation/metabolism regulation signal transduction histidine kinase
VTLFAVVALAPAVVVALFFGLLVTRAWTVGSASALGAWWRHFAAVANGYRQEQINVLDVEMDSTATDLNRVGRVPGRRTEPGFRNSFSFRRKRACWTPFI